MIPTLAWRVRIFSSSNCATVGLSARTSIFDLPREAPVTLHGYSYAEMLDEDPVDYESPVADFASLRNSQIRFCRVRRLIFRISAARFRLLFTHSRVSLI